MIDNRIAPVREIELAIAVSSIMTIKDTKIAIPDTRALSSIAVQSDINAVTSGKHSPNDIPTNAVETKEKVVP